MAKARPLSGTYLWVVSGLSLASYKPGWGRGGHAQGSSYCTNVLNYMSLKKLKGDTNCSIFPITLRQPQRRVTLKGGTSGPRGSSGCSHLDLGAPRKACHTGEQACFTVMPLRAPEGGVSDTPLGLTGDVNFVYY